MYTVKQVPETFEDIQITLKGVLGKYIQGSSSHFIESRTPKGDYIYFCNLLVNGKAITFQTNNSIVKHITPLKDSVTITGYKHTRIFKAIEISLTHNVRNIY